MRARAFDGDAYLRLFPDGNRAAEFRPVPPAPTPDVPTLREYAEETWLPRQQPPDVRPSCARDYRQHLRTYVLDAPVAGTPDALGDLPLSDITTRHMQGLRDRLVRSLGLTVKTTRNVIGGSLRALFRDAWEIDGLIDANPCAALRWPRKDARPPDPFSAEERDLILGYFRSRHPHLHAFVALQFLTGTRPSEAAALRWGDFDPRRGTISINKSRNMGVDGATKTQASNRAIRLVPHLAEMLAERMPLHAAGDDFIFTMPTTRTPVDPGEWAKYYWHRALRAAGVRPRKFYNCRHTFISLAMTAGSNAKFIAEYCGTSLAMIERHYGRFMPGSTDAQMVLLAEAFEGANSAPNREKARPKTGAVAVSGGKAFISKVVPTGLEPVLPT